MTKNEQNKQATAVAIHLEETDCYSYNRRGCGEIYELMDRASVNSLG